MSELKPCPFCGAKARVEDYGSFKVVGCSKLSMLCPNPRMAVYNNDFSHWNERIETNGEMDLRETLRLKELECQQLAQDKAELVGGLQRVIASGTQLLNVDDCDDDEDSASIHANFNEHVISAEKLLEKHK